LAIASVRNQFITCVAVPIFAASSSGQLKDIIVTFSQLTPEKNQSAHNVVCMSAVKAQADKCPVDPPLERSVIEMVLAGWSRKSNDDDDDDDDGQSASKKQRIVEDEKKQVEQLQRDILCGWDQMNKVHQLKMESGKSVRFLATPYDALGALRLPR